MDVRRWNRPHPLYTVDHAQDQSFGVSVTVANPRQFPIEGLQPKSRCHSQIVTQVDGRKLRMNWQLDNNGAIRDRAWIGATVEAYRIVSGDRVMVGTFTVVDANFGRWRYAGPNKRTAYTQAGGFSHHHRNYSQADVFWEMRPRWFGVAAVDATGQIGEISYAEYTPTSLASGANLSNDNTIALAADYTTGGPLPAPASVVAAADASGPATANVTHDAVPGAVGYIHFLAWDDPATHPDFKFLEVDGDGIQEGDEIVVRRQFTGPLRTEWLATRTMGLMDGRHGFQQLYPGERYSIGAPWQREGVIDTSVVAYDGPDVGAGDWAVQFDFGAASGTGNIDLFADFWNAQSTQSFYTYVPPGDRFRFMVRIWASRTAQIRLNTGLNGSPVQTYTVSPGWQTLELIGTPTSPATSPRAAYVQYERDGDPIVIRLAGVEMRPVEGTELFSPGIAAQLSPGMTVRDHTFIKVMPDGYAVQDLLTADFQGVRNYSIHQFLKSCEAAAVKPWLQVEPFLSPSEWEYLGDFLCAPVSSGKAGALKRQALGRDAPWSEAFDELLLEFGNEAWNGIGSFFNAPADGRDSVTDESYNGAEYYGLMSRHGAQTLTASAHWPDHIKFVLGGWAAQPWFSEGALRGFRLPCYVGIANYNGGWDVGGTLVSENAASYQNTLTSAAASQIRDMDNLVAGLQGVCAEVGLSYGTDVRPTCYEAGPGYQLSGLNGATLSTADVITQEVVMKSRAAGTATLHTALAQAARGFAHFNFFIIGTGNYWKSHAPDAQGGAVYPQWQVIRKLHELFGTMRVTEAQGDDPERIDVQDHRGNDATVDATFVYMIESDSYTDRKGLVAANISIAQPETCRIETGWSAVDVGAMSGWFLNGPYDAHNRYPVGQRLAPDGSYVPDPKSVEIDVLGMSLMLPGDPSLLQTDDSLGFGPDGMGAGNCGFIVVDA
jgi:hypothetical protein